MDTAAVVELVAANRRGAVATLIAAFIADPVERWLYPAASEYLTHFGRFVEALAGRAFSRTPDQVRERIIALRTDLMGRGLDAGPVTIAWHLGREGLSPARRPRPSGAFSTPPAPSTLARSSRPT